METSYCGKSCEKCPGREEHRCPGCGLGPCGYLIPGSECPIVKCCKEQGISSCGNCRGRELCHVYEHRAELPITRLHTKQEAMAGQLRKAKRLAPRLALLAVLFLLRLFPAIYSVAAGGIENEIVDTYLSNGIWIAYGLILLSAGNIHPRFYGAGILELGSLFLAGVVDEDFAFPMFLLVIAALLFVAGLYCEFSACAGTVQFYNPRLALRWRRLCRLLVCLAGIFLIVFLAVVYNGSDHVSVLMLLFLLSCVVFSVFLLVLRLRTIRFLKELKAAPNAD